MELYPHQKRFLDENPDHALLAFDAGTGKTLTAILWMEKRPSYKHLIIVPKNIKGKWKDDMKPYSHIRHLVVTKEEYKKITDMYDSFVVDEADFFGAPLFMKGRSKLVEKLYNDIKDYSPNVLLMTATPFRSAPHTIHTLLTFVKKAMLWRDWQRQNYSLQMLPYLPTPAWIKDDKWREFAVPYAMERMYTAKITDIADVPTQYEDMHTIKTERLDETISETAVGEWHEKARRESGVEKLEFIKEYIRGKSKVVIVCRYKSTIEEYRKELEKEREVFVLTGETRNADDTIRKARDSFECVFIMQSSVGAGFELPEFSYMIFAQMSFSSRDHIQSKGRILRINNLKSNWYTYLIGGPKDLSVYKSVKEAEKDFVLDDTEANPF